MWSNIIASAYRNQTNLNKNHHHLAANPALVSPQKSDVASVSNVNFMISDSSCMMHHSQQGTICFFIALKQFTEKESI